MDVLETEETDRPSRPNTLVVLGLLVLAAMILSYLVAYAVINALVAAEVMPPWQGQQDPRPRLFIGSFVALMSLFAFVGGAAKFLSSRHLRRIDAIGQDDLT
jgi:hypothetical protein